MWRIFGYCKKTLRLVDVAIARNAAERKRILEEESGNYFNLDYAKVL